MLTAQIIEDEQRGCEHRLEPLVIAYSTARAVCSSQMIQEIGHHNEEGWMAPLEAVVGDTRCQMSFAATVAAKEYQPALRVLGKLSRPSIRLFETLLLAGAKRQALKAEVLKDHVR